MDKSSQPTGQQDTPESLPAVDTALLGALLQRLNLSVQTGALNEVAAAVQQNTDLEPVQQLNRIFADLKLTGVNTAQVRWRRFDQRRLPALVFYQQAWWLAEKTETQELQLTGTQGQVQACEEAELEHALVLWVRTPAQRSVNKAFSFKGNRAASLVLQAVFRDRRWVFDVLIATVVINLLAIATSLFAMQVYDRVVPTLAYSTLWTLVAAMLIVIGLDWTLKTFRARTLDSVASNVDKTVSQQVFEHVMHLRLDTRPRSLGTLAAQLNGLDSVRHFFTSGTVFILADMPFALMFLAFIWAIGGPIAWVYLLLMPVAAVLGWVTQKRLRALTQRQLIRANERQGMLVDAIQGTESIRVHNASWRFSRLWQELTASVQGYHIQQKAISSFATVTTGSLSTLAYISALVVGVSQIDAGNLTMGALIASSILGGRVIAPIAQAVQLLAQWQNVTQSLQMVNQVLELDSERRPEQVLLMPDSAPRSVALDGVRFCYPGSPVKQLDIRQLEFRAGERVALLGGIGSGKSTLLKVLAGLYRPSEGRVRLGEADLWEIDPGLVANQVAYLPQSVDLFKGTLLSNLVLSGAASDDSVLRVCKDLGIDRIINNSPKGLGHEIFEGGDGLSGGQKQLVGLARVLLSQPKIWLLDEPTSSLDPQSEAQVLEAILEHVKPDDILLIATHRPLLASKLATRVLVAEDGRIVEDGSPESILPRLMNPQQKRPGAAVRKHAVMADAGVKRGGINVI